MSDHYNTKNTNNTNTVVSDDNDCCVACGTSTLPTSAVSTTETQTIQPVQTQPALLQPVQTTQTSAQSQTTQPPAQSLQPVQQPAQTQPTQSQPTLLQPVQSQPAQSQPAQSQQTGFNQNTPATRDNFPTAAGFKQLCVDTNFRNVLNMVMARMLTANSDKQPFARILTQDTVPFSNSSVKEVKAFLITRGYKLTDIEDASGNSMGWKISWQDPIQPQQPTQPLQAGFNQNTPATRDNFPTAAGFKLLCAKIHFDSMLNMVMTRMLTANSNNQLFARFTTQDTLPYPDDSVKDVKAFLVSQNYEIIDVEDPYGNITGWKIALNTS